MKEGSYRQFKVLHSKSDLRYQQRLSPRAEAANSDLVIVQTQKAPKPRARQDLDKLKLVNLHFIEQESSDEPLRKVKPTNSLENTMSPKMSAEIGEDITVLISPENSKEHLQIRVGSTKNSK